MVMRRTAFGVMAAAATAALLGGAAAAETFPSRPITLIVPFAAGGAADAVARIVAQEASGTLGQPVVVESRAGAGGSVGAAGVARANPDGYTLLFVTAGHSVLSALYHKLSFDPIKDFRPVAGVATSPIGIAVSAESAYRTMADFVAAAKADPGKLNCAGGGGGATVTNLALELLKSDLGLDIKSVPYRGSGPAMIAIMSREIDCNSDSLSVLLPFAEAKTARVLAVASAMRSHLLPDTPTIAETVLPGFEASVWFGVIAPRRTPDEIAARLSRAFGEALAKPEIREKLRLLGADPMTRNPDEFGAFMVAETERWSAVIKRLGLSAN